MKPLGAGRAADPELRGTLTLTHAVDAIHVLVLFHGETREKAKKRSEDNKGNE